MKTNRPGFWASALSSDVFAKQAGRLGDIKAGDVAVYWVKQLPAEKGRQVIMRWDGAEVTCLTERGLSIGNAVNVYGGVSFCVTDDTVYFSNKKDLRWYRQHKDEAAVAITPTANETYGDPVVTPDGEWLICVREKLVTPVSQDLVAINTQSGECHVLCDGSDFYASPRLNADGTQLAYVTWQMPHMPWEETQLRVADIDRLVLKNTRVIPTAGFQSQPTWVGNELYCLSDHDGLGKLYHYHEEALVPVANHWPANADGAMPIWNIGIQTFVPLGADTFAVMVSLQGSKRLCMIERGEFKECALPFIALGDYLVTWRGKLIFNGATATTPFALYAYDPKSGHFHMLEDAPAPILSEKEISIGNPITYETRDGAVAHAFYYAPKHAEEKLEGLPPLLVMSHGGPTSATHPGYNHKIQFWTNRGFAVVDVNYRGSTGYGRAYWEALNRQWGEVDVIDCMDAAAYLCQQGLADPLKCFIRGSSAGGFLALRALSLGEQFTAAAIYYGIADLTAFLKSTHRFEAGYNDWLIGPYPEEKQRYHDRSPIHHVKSITTPVIFFHGGEDTVVPPEQSEMMVAALNDKGIPTEYYLYPSEGHGFREAETIIDTLDKELAFYQRFL